MLTTWRNDSLKEKGQWVKINGDQAAGAEQQFEGAPLLSHRNSLLSFISQVPSGQNTLANLKYVILNFSQQSIDFFEARFLGAAFRSAVDSRTGCGAGKVPQCAIPSAIWRLCKGMERDRICYNNRTSL